MNLVIEQRSGLARDFSPMPLSTMLQYLLFGFDVPHVPISSRCTKGFRHTLPHTLQGCTRGFHFHGPLAMWKCTKRIPLPTASCTVVVYFGNPIAHSPCGSLFREFHCPLPPTPVVWPCSEGISLPAAPLPATPCSVAL